MAIFGRVEQLGKKIVGWAVDTESNTPINVTIQLDGIPVKSIRPIFVREEFPNVATGFKYYLKEVGLLPYLDDRISPRFFAGGVELPIINSSFKLLPLEQRRPLDELLLRLSSDYILTKKGTLRLKLKNDFEWQRRTFDFYDYARTKFRHAAGYDLFATYGTLLGYSRERGFIGSDDDFDVGYLSRYTHASEVRDEMFRIMCSLVKSGERISIPKRRNFFYWRTKDASLDVFPAWISGEMFYETFAICGPHAHIFSRGLKEVSLMDRAILVPIADEEACEAIYGPNWKTPDPLFQWTSSEQTKQAIKPMRLNKKQLIKFENAKETQPSSPITVE